MNQFQSYNDFINKEHEVTASIGKIYGKRAKDTDGSLQSIPESNSIYITFDYCPSSILNEEVLDILRSEKIPCTLFISTQAIDKDSKFEDRLKGIDYSIGGHSQSHKTANEISEIDQQKEIERNIAYLSNRFKQSIQYYRFPNGISTPQSLAVLSKNKVKPVSWFNGVMDSRTRTYFELGVDGSIKKIEDKFNLLKPDMIPGKIFLFHLGKNGDRTDHYLKDFIKYCKENKLTFSKL